MCIYIYIYIVIYIYIYIYCRPLALPLSPCPPHASLPLAPALPATLAYALSELTKYCGIVCLTLRAYKILRISMSALKSNKARHFASSPKDPRLAERLPARWAIQEGVYVICSYIQKGDRNHSNPWSEQRLGPSRPCASAEALAGSEPPPGPGAPGVALLAAVLAWEV